MSRVSNSKKILPPLDYIAGIVACSGSFILVRKGKRYIPVFQIKLGRKELDTLLSIKEKLGLKERVYKYTHDGKRYALLIIRSAGTIREKIIPAFDNRLFGKKAKKFEKWTKVFFKRQLDKNPRLV